MASKSKSGTSQVQKNALRVVELEHLKVDPAYQRGITPGAKKIARDYDPVSFGIPLVAQRHDGSLWVVDGQQRIEALRIRGSHKWVRCEVFASKGPEHEAEVFKNVNKNRTQLQPLQLFHAMLTAGDEHCWKIKDLVEKHGFTIPKGGIDHNTAEQRAKQFKAVAMLSRVLTRYEEAGIDFVLSTIAKVWPDDPLRTKGEVIGGLGIFWKNHEGVVDVDRLIPRLNSTTPTKLIYSAQLGVGDRNQNVSEVIEKLYRKRTAKK
jgi:hypothetical protein